MKASSTAAFDIYAAFLTDTHIFVKGRALKTSLQSKDYNQGILRSLLTSIRLALSKELKKLTLKLVVNGESYPTITDHEGYFEWSIPINLPTGRSHIGVELCSSTDEDAQPTLVKLKTITGELPIGIISDIDDTVMLTHVKSFFKIRMIFNTVFINPFKRKPIENAAKFYSKYLAAAPGETPIFYISNSPWNMHHYLTSFLTHHGFPAGILLLRDFGLQMFKRKQPLIKQNKYLLIVRMLDLFPKTKFILIGDSAEVDFDIYMKIKYNYPDSISHIIIRKASNSKNENRISQSLDDQTRQYVSIIDGFDDEVVFQN